jgi:hypothetical protein
MYLALVYRLVQQKMGAQVCWHIHVMPPDINTSQPPSQAPRETVPLP